MSGRLRHAGRILRTAVRWRLDTLVRAALEQHGRLPRALIWLRWLPSPASPDGERLRQALESLGPVFIKFGQILSTRRDLLPTELADELAYLQDRVPQFPGEQALSEIDSALGDADRAEFAHIDSTPMAAASIAQVHPGTLVDGTAVALKVRRPDIGPLIDRDLKLLHGIAAWLDQRFADAWRLRLPEIVRDYEHTLRGELDLAMEARQTIRLRLNFAQSELLYVPRVYEHLCRDNLLVLELIHGIPVSAVDALRAAGTDMKLLAERGVQTFFTQVFDHNYFHADMHPGNVLVDVSDPADPHWIALDCAIMGSLEPADQSYLARNLLAFFQRDYAEVVRLHLESGWIPPQTDAQEFETVIADLCEPIFSRPLAEISFGAFLLDLFRTAHQFDMQVQPQLILLQKTLLNIEGLGRQLYPQLDLWETAAPFMQRWVAERAGPAAALERVAKRAPELIALLPRLPEILLDGEQQLTNLRREVAIARYETRALARNLPRRRSSRLLGLALVAAGGASLLAPGTWPVAAAVIMSGGLLLVLR